jgi:hypothetical protein
MTSMSLDVSIVMICDDIPYCIISLNGYIIFSRSTL